MTEPSTPTGPVSVPFKVSLLRRRVGDSEPFAEQVDLGPIETTAAELSGPVGADLTLRATADGVVVSGELTVPWSGSCRRCLERTSGQATATVRELFSDGLVRERREGVDEAPVEDAYPIDGDWIDLGPLLHDATVLALPLAPLCDQDCRGPEPGEFPVHTADEPVEAPEDPRWAALSELRFDSD